jgi:hypothetical protein
MINIRKAVLLLSKSSTGFGEKQYRFQAKAVRLLPAFGTAFLYAE